MDAPTFCPYAQPHLHKAMQKRTHLDTQGYVARSQILVSPTGVAMVMVLQPSYGQVEAVVGNTPCWESGRRSESFELAL